MSNKIGDDMDLAVSACPYTYEGEEFLLMSLIDISSKNRREALEHIFFHDIVNTAGAMQGLIYLMMDAGPAEVKSYVTDAAKASGRLIGQILSQKDLAAAERGDLRPDISQVRTTDLLNEIASLFRAHPVAKDKSIVLAGNCQDLR